jgi:hypothetical protein
MNPSIGFGEFFMTGRTRHGGMICVTKNYVRGNSINTDPLNLRRELLIGMALLAFQGRWQLFQLRARMTGGAGNLFLHVLSMGKIEWLTNRRGPAKINKSHQ